MIYYIYSALSLDRMNQCLDINSSLVTVNDSVTDCLAAFTHIHTQIHSVSACIVM